jgi:hypothetical protein
MQYFFSTNKSAVISVFYKSATTATISMYHNAASHHTRHNHSRSLFNLHMPKRLGQESECAALLEMGMHSLLVLRAPHHNTTKDLSLRQMPCGLGP